MTAVGGAIVAIVIATGVFAIARSGPSTTPVPPAQPSLIVTSDNATFPSACRPERIGRLVLGFFAAFNEADERHLDRFFPRRTFRWYSVGAGPGRRSGEVYDPSGRYNAYNRDGLLPYFAERHDRGEWLQLVELRVNHAQVATQVTDLEIPPTPVAGVQFRVLRWAKDFPREKPVSYFGKTEIDCRAGGFVTWTMAPEGEVPAVAYCPQPRRRPARAAVACATAPIPPAIAADVRVHKTELTLPAKCRPGTVRALVARMLSSFNRGEGREFDSLFVRPSFHPYTFRISGAGFTDRGSITRFVGERHAAGDGWTAIELAPPTGDAGLPRDAIYGISLRVTQYGRPISGGPFAAKLVVDCASGLASRWVGPARGPKDVRAERR